MNELQAYQERLSTYEEKVEQLKADKENLKVYLESGSMKQIEVDARSEYIDYSIEMFEEKITKYKNKIKDFKGGEVVTEHLYSAAELADILHMSKQGLHYQERTGKIQAPAYTIGKSKGWTLRQVREIKEGRTNETQKGS